MCEIFGITRGRRLRSSEKLAELGLRKMFNYPEDPLKELLRGSLEGFVSKRLIEPA